MAIFYVVTMFPLSLRMFTSIPFLPNKRGKGEIKQSDHLTLGLKLNYTVPETYKMFQKLCMTENAHIFSRYIDNTSSRQSRDN